MIAEEAADPPAEPPSEQSASEDEDRQEVENPRIAVQENLDMMQDVGVVTEEEADEQERTRQELEQIQQDLGLEEVESLGLKIVGTSDRVMEVTRKPLTYIQENVPFLTKRDIIFFGRFEVDGAKYSEGVLSDDSGFILRRLRLGLAGHLRFWEGWNYKLEVDLTDGENTLADAYIFYRSERWGTFRFGNQKVAQTLSGQTSSLSISFMERPLPVLAFTLQRRLGIGWDTHLKRLGANITLFSRDPNKGVGSRGWAARGYFNPTRTKFSTLHIGASYMELVSDDDARLRARPESQITDIRLVDTGSRAVVDETRAAGLELAGSRGGITFRSEFYRSEWVLPERESRTFSGWYAEVSRFMTGEDAHYRDGKFIRPNVAGEHGAWEIALRVSSIDLDDDGVNGGKQTNVSFGINWYSKTHWRFMANVIHARVEGGPYGDQEPWIVQARTQYYF